MDTVNISTADRPYHHGRLRGALIEAGLQLARASGPDAVVLRAATRAAGVSHNAAYRHFADREQLLDAVGEQCMAALAAAMRASMAEVVAGDDAERAVRELAAIGRAYVEWAVAEPGMFRTAFAAAAVDNHDRTDGARTDATDSGAAVPTAAVAAAGLSAAEAFGGDEAGPGPFGMLTACLDRLVVVGVLPAQRRPGAELAAWSAVHGLSDLLAEGPLSDLPAAEAEQAIQVVLDVVLRGL